VSSEYVNSRYSRVEVREKIACEQASRSRNLLCSSKPGACSQARKKKEEITQGCEYGVASSAVTDIALEREEKNKTK
jgi:hypothetical protein